MARKTSRYAFWAPILLIFLLSPLSAPAMGSRENPLSEAEALIKEKKLNEAVLLLTEYIKDNPEDFYHAQKLLRRIVEIRNAFNKTGEQLVTALVETPEDYEEHERLINKLRTLGPPDDPEVARVIDAAEKTALAVLNQQRMMAILREGRSLAAASRYVEAARQYTTGFTLYRSTFESSGYNAISVRGALARTEEIGRQIDRFEDMQESLNSTTAALREAFSSGDTRRIDAALADSEDALAALANLRAETLATGMALERQYDIFRKADPELTDASFLPFAFRFILGRPNEEEPEGVAGAMASQWAALFDSAAGAADADLARRYSDSEARYSEGNYKEANAGFLLVRDLADRSLGFQGMWSIFLPTDVQEGARAFGRNLITTRGADYLRLQHLRDTAVTHAELCTLRGELAAQENRERDTTTALTATIAAAGREALSPETSLAGSLPVYRAVRTRAVEILRAVETLGQVSGRGAAELARVSEAGFRPRGAAELQAALDERIASSEDYAKAFETRAVALSAKSEVDILEYRVRSRSADVERSRRLLEGVAPEGSPEGSPKYTYPTRSLQLLAETDRLLGALRGYAADIGARYSAETPYVASAPSVVIQMERARALDAEAARLAEAGTALAAAARDRQRQAQTNKLEADRRFAEARSALNRDDFDTARERLERARERYSASLAFDEIPELRSQSDRDLVALAEQIVRAENELVVRDTRRLLTEGKTFYNQGDFPRAEESLLQARARWRITHTDETEPEVEYWITTVQRALSVKTGRDIPQTAPLYPEMSQLLSLAKQYFQEGKTALENRDKPSALRSFEASRKRIQEVKVVFPLNQEARVLDLRIDQLSDPDAFNREFRRLVESARQKADAYAPLKRQKLRDQRTLDAEEALKEEYGTLLDLQAIDPRYSGLKALIDRVEILLGIKPEPPDPRDLAESRALTARAQRIWDSRDVSQFTTALAMLNPALQLDPNNVAASRLKDRILTYTGGTGGFILDAAGESLYQEAAGYLQRGDYVSARVSLNRLYERDSKARRVQKVSDLESRLKARGY